MKGETEPTKEEAKAFIMGCTMMSEHLGNEKTEQELIKQLWEEYCKLRKCRKYEMQKLQS